MIAASGPNRLDVQRFFQFFVNRKVAEIGSLKRKLAQIGTGSGLAPPVRIPARRNRVRNSIVHDSINLL